jgi:STE24 endopeptidase
MPLFLLFYLILTAMPLPWPEPRFGLGPGASAVVAAGLTAVPTMVAWLLAHRARRQLAAAPHRRREVVRRYARGKVGHVYGLMAAHLLGLALGWGWGAEYVWGGAATELLRMAPFLAGLGLAWACYYPADKAVHQTGPAGGAGPFASRAGYVAFLARQHLAFTGVPLALFLLQQEVVRAAPALLNDGRFWLVPVGVVTLALTLAPWALKTILGLRPLPPGRLRDRLAAAGRRLGVRYADILLWDTRGGVANAMVAGVVPWVRYVLLSDRLLVELTPDEVEAVFGHEAGHVRHGHMVFYLLFLAMSLAALSGVWTAATEAVWGRPVAVAVAGAVDGGGPGGWREWEPVPVVLLAGAYVFVAFGFVSRRCERQADLYGCRAVSCGREHCAGHDPGAALPPAGRGLCPTGIRTFIGALEKVAAVNGISRDRPGWLHVWLHGSIARRVAFLDGVLVDRAAAAAFQRRVGLLKWGLVAALAAALVGLELAGYGGRVWAGI